MTTTKPPRDLSRRRLLATLPAAAASCAMPHAFSQASFQPSRALPPFSTFTDIAASAGLTKPMFYGDSTRARYIIENMGGGCAFFDFDNDGWLDIFLLGGRTLEGVPAGATNRLYRNNRDGTFADVTEKAGLHDAGWACGVTVGDYNNDGFEDLFLTYYGQNRLYRNNGDGTFTDVTQKAGLLEPTRADKPRFNTGCTFFDYNRDGHLDLFVANYVGFDPASTPLPSLAIPNCNYEGVPVYCGPKGLPDSPHTLYRNNGDGTFTDVSKESGISAVRGSYGLTAMAFDADEDGWPDLLVACDSTPSLLLMNNRDGTFREEALLRGVALSGDGEMLGGMGLALGDFNLDGHLDVAKTHFHKQATGLYRNDGKGNFEDVTLATGLGAERRFISWGTGLVDLDNDNFPDLFVVTGTTNPELAAVYPKYPVRGPRLVFRNRGDGTFAQISETLGPAILSPHQSRGCAFGDFDNDGDLDILIMNMNEAPSLLRNDAPPANHWLKIRLEGTRSNRSALNTRVTVRFAGKILVQELVSQSSYLSANDPRLHFGLGAATLADIEVRWLGGATETFKQVAANQLITIRESHGIVPSRAFHR
jgi:hypothetical protein